MSKKKVVYRYREKKKGSSTWKWALGLGAVGVAGYFVYEWLKNQGAGLPLSLPSIGGTSFGASAGGAGGGTVTSTPSSGTTSTAAQLVNVLTGQSQPQTAGQAAFATSAFQNFVRTMQHAAQVYQQQQGNPLGQYTAASYATYISNLAKSTANMLQANMPGLTPVAKLANLQIAERELGAVNNFLNQVSVPATLPRTPLPVFTNGRYTIYRGSWFRRGISDGH